MGYKIPVFLQGISFLSAVEVEAHVRALALATKHLQYLSTESASVFLDYVGCLVRLHPVIRSGPQRDFFKSSSSGPADDATDVVASIQRWVIASAPAISRLSFTSKILTALRQVGRGITLGTVPFTDGSARGSCATLSAQADIGSFVADRPCSLEVFVARRPGRVNFVAPDSNVVGSMALGASASQKLQEMDNDMVDIVVFKSAVDLSGYQRPENDVSELLVPVSTVVGVEVHAVGILDEMGFDASSAGIHLLDLGTNGPIIPIDGTLSEDLSTPPHCGFFNDSTGLWTKDGVVDTQQVHASHSTTLPCPLYLQQLYSFTLNLRLGMPVYPLDPFCTCGISGSCSSSTTTNKNPATTSNIGG